MDGTVQGGLVLALDTTGERCSAGLFDSGTGRMRASAEPLIGKGHAERLTGIVAGVLEEAGLAYADLSRIVVVVGPGSFTGIRVGVAAARGLALALGIPAVGVGTLEALAEPHLGSGAAVLAVQDARRGEVYAALSAAGGTLLAGPRALAPDELAAFAAPAAGHGLLRVTGSGAAIAAGALGTRPVEIVDVSGVPAIASVARLGALRTPGEAPRPLYLRGADARPQASTAHLLAVSSSPPASILK